jgi:hypothetical protein
MYCNKNKAISIQELLDFFEEGNYNKITYHKPTSKYINGFTQKGDSIIKINNNDQNIIINIFSVIIRKENSSNIEKKYNENYTLIYSKLNNKVYMSYQDSLGSYSDGFHLVNYDSNYLEFKSNNSNSEALNKECIQKKYLIEKKIINCKIKYLVTISYKENNVNEIFQIKLWDSFINKIESRNNTLFLWSEAKGWTNKDFTSFPNQGNQFTNVHVIIPDGNADPKSNIKPSFTDIFNPVQTFYKNIIVKSWINIYFGETKTIVKGRINNILNDNSIMSNVIGFSFDLESVTGSDWTLQEAVDYIESLTYNGKPLKKAWSTGPLSVRKEANPKNIGKTQWDYLWAQFYTIGPPYDKKLYNSTCKPKDNSDFSNGLLEFPKIKDKTITNVATPVIMLCGGGDCQTIKSTYGYCIDERLCSTWLSNFINSTEYKNFINDSGINNLAVYYGSYGGLLPPPAGGGQKGCCDECGGIPCVPSC